MSELYKCKMCGKTVPNKAHLGRHFSSGSVGLNEEEKFLTPIITNASKTSKRCFYCNGKFYKHENDINWRTGNGKDFAHLECYNTACTKLSPPGKAYDDLKAGIKSVQFDQPLVRTEIREMEELEL